MDADDICESTRFEAQVAWLDARPGALLGNRAHLAHSLRATDVDLCGSNATIIDADETVVRETDHPTDAGALHFGMFFACCIVHPTVVARRHVYETAAYIEANARGQHAEDYDLWLRLIVAPRLKLANLRQPLLVRDWRSPSRSLSARR